MNSQKLPKSQVQGWASAVQLWHMSERETGGGEAARQREGSIYCHVREDLAREGALFHWALLTSHTHSSNSLPCILKKNLQKMDVVWLAQIISSLASELLQVWKKKGTPIHTTYASACCRKKQMISWDNILVWLLFYLPERQLRTGLLDAAQNSSLLPSLHPKWHYQ